MKIDFNELIPFFENSIQELYKIGNKVYNLKIDKIEYSKQCYYGRHELDLYASGGYYIYAKLKDDKDLKFDSNELWSDNVSFESDIFSSIDDELFENTLDKDIIVKYNKKLNEYVNTNKILKVKNEVAKLADNYYDLEVEMDRCGSDYSKIEEESVKIIKEINTLLKQINYKQCCIKIVGLCKDCLYWDRDDCHSKPKVYYAGSNKIFLADAPNMHRCNYIDIFKKKYGSGWMREYSDSYQSCNDFYPIDSKLQEYNDKYNCY